MDRPQFSGAPVQAQPERKRKTDRRSLIRTTALSLFAERGYDRTSLKDIADRIGITHPALYYYYKSKSDILFDAIRTALVQTGADLSACIDDETLNAEQKLHRLIETQITVQLDLQEANRLIDSVLFGTMSRSEIFNYEQTKELLELQRQLVQPYRTVLADGVEAGCFDVTDETVVTFAILGAVSNLPYWYNPDGELSVPDVTARLVSLFLKSIKP